MDDEEGDEQAATSRPVSSSSSLFAVAGHSRPVRANSPLHRSLTSPSTQTDETPVMRSRHAHHRSRRPQRRSFSDGDMEKMRRFIVEYAPLKHRVQAEIDEQIPFRKFFGLGGVLQPFLNGAAENIGSIVQAHKRSMKAFICYKWPSDLTIRDKFQEKVRLMRSFLRGAGVGATMDVIDNDSGDISQYRATLGDTDAILVAITNEFLNSAIEWKADREKKKKLKNEIDHTGTAEVVEGPNDSHLWRELDEIEKRLELEGKKPSQTRQLIYPVVVEHVQDVEEKLHQLWPKDPIYREMWKPKDKHEITAFAIDLWINYFKDRDSSSPIISALQDERKRLTERLERFHGKMVEILHNEEPVMRASEVLAETESPKPDDGIYARMINTDKLLKNPNLDSNLRKNLFTCFKSYYIRRRFGALNNQYRETSAHHKHLTERSSPLNSQEAVEEAYRFPHAVACRGLSSPVPIGGHQSVHFDFAVERPKSPDAYEVFFKQEENEGLDHIVQTDTLGLGVYHFVAARRLQAFEESLPNREPISIVKTHDGYEVGNAAYKAYKTAINYFSHIKQNNWAVKYFTSLCYQGQANLHMQRRVGQPWDCERDFHLHALFRAKQLLEKSLENSPIQIPSMSFVRLVQIAYAQKNFPEIILHAQKWQDETKIFKGTDGLPALATRESHLIDYHADIQAAQERFSSISKRMLDYVDQVRRLGSSANALLVDMKMSRVCKRSDVGRIQEEGEEDFGRRHSGSF
tara:strand:- start:30526 stop:32763 length:2238 start_codon:yes stop_codon:yes gene_type:complete